MSGGGPMSDPGPEPPHSEALVAHAGRMLESGETLATVHVPAQPDRLKLIRAMIEAAGTCIGESRAWTNDLMLAVDEACQNVIRHAYGGQPGGRLTVILYRDERYVLVRVLDAAPPIDPARITPRPLEALRPGGLGTHFIAAVMDHVEYRPATAAAAASDALAPEQGNELRMIKQLAR